MGAPIEQWGKTMGNVGKMRTAVAALEQAARAAAKERELPRSAIVAGELAELRQWRLESACRYVGKSVVLAKREGSK
jgi:hypothetical protein